MASNRRLRARTIIGFYFMGLIFVLAACQVGGKFGPEADGDAAGGDLSAVAIEVSHAQLATDSETYLNQLIQITGAFVPPTQARCERHVRGPFDRWGLVNQEWRLDVVGYDDVTDYLPEGLVLTVTGYFRRYEGQLGCGKDADVTTVWYLDISHIVAPNPLPLGTGGVDDVVVTPLAEPTLDPFLPTPTLAAIFTPTATLPAPAGATPTLPFVVFTATPIPSSTPPLLFTATPIATPSPMPTEVDGTVTPSVTATPTATGTLATPTPTNTPAPGDTPPPQPSPTSTTSSYPGPTPAPTSYP